MILPFCALRVTELRTLRHIKKRIGIIISSRSDMNSKLISIIATNFQSEMTCIQVNGVNNHLSSFSKELGIK